MFLIEQVQLQPVEDKEEYIDEREFNEIETPEHEGEQKVEETVEPETEVEDAPEQEELASEYDRIMTEGLAEKEAAEAEAQNEPEHEAEGSDEQVTEPTNEQEPERVDVQPFNEYPSSDEGFSY